MKTTNYLIDELVKGMGKKKTKKQFDARLCTLLVRHRKTISVDRQLLDDAYSMYRRLHHMSWTDNMKGDNFELPD